MDGLLIWIVCSVGGGQGYFYSIEQKESFRLVSISSPGSISFFSSSLSYSYSDKLLSTNMCSTTTTNDGEDRSDNYSKANVEKQPLTPSRPQEPSLASEKMNSKAVIASNAIVSAQKKKQRKKSDSKKVLGKAKIQQLREHRLKMGLKVASKADAC